MLRPDKSKKLARNSQSNWRIPSKYDAIPEIEKKRGKVSPPYKNAKSKIAEYIAGRISARDICPPRKNTSSCEELSSTLSTSKPIFRRHVSSSQEFLSMLPVRNKSGLREYVASKGDTDQSDSSGKILKMTNVSKNNDYYAKVDGNYSQFRRIDNYSNNRDDATGIDLNESEIFGSEETMKVSDRMNEIDQTGSHNTLTINQRYALSPNESSLSYVSKESSLFRTICESFDQQHLSKNKYCIHRKEFIPSDFQTDSNSFRQTLKVINCDKPREGRKKQNAESTDFPQLGKANHLIADKRESRVERTVSKTGKKMSLNKILRNLIAKVGDVSREMNVQFSELEGRIAVMDKKLEKLTTDKLLTSHLASELEINKDDQISVLILDWKNGEISHLKSASNNSDMSAHGENSSSEQSSAFENDLKNQNINELEKASNNSDMSAHCENSSSEQSSAIENDSKNQNINELEKASNNSDMSAHCENSSSEQSSAIENDLKNQNINELKKASNNNQICELGDDSNCKGINVPRSDSKNEKIEENGNASTNNPMSVLSDDSNSEGVVAIEKSLKNDEIGKPENASLNQQMNELIKDSNSENIIALGNILNKEKIYQTENASKNNETSELGYNANCEIISTLRNDLENEKIDNPFTNNEIGEFCDNLNLAALENDSDIKNACAINQMYELETNLDSKSISALQSVLLNDEIDFIENVSINLISELENTPKNTPQSVIYSRSKDNSYEDTGKKLRATLCKDLFLDTNMTSQEMETEIDCELELGEKVTENVETLLSKLAQVAGTLKVKLLQNNDTSSIDTIDDLNCLKRFDNLPEEDVYNVYKKLLEKCNF